MTEDLITPEVAGTLPGLFRERVKRTPDSCAYRFFDALNETWSDSSWRDIAKEVDRWQAAIASEGLKPNDRVAIMASNSRFWITFDQAALGLGLVLVPLYTDDRVDNVAYILGDSSTKLLVIGGQWQWTCLQEKITEMRTLKRIISIANILDNDEKRLISLNEWLPLKYEQVEKPYMESNSVATIVYTSGTTGSPKGVMLSHWNILTNTYNSLQTILPSIGNVFLSFLPLSHTLERTIGYYLPIMIGATVAHNRSIPELGSDLQAIRPTALISVPRIFERVYQQIKDKLAKGPAISRFLFNLTVGVGWRRFLYQQGRASIHPSIILWPILKSLVADKVAERLGGNLRMAISGGAALAPDISRVFIALGIPLVQGYGLTEASPVVSVNRLENNIPSSIGIPLPGVEVKIGKNNELLVRGDNVMLGFWNNPEATEAVLDEDDWLYTGDKARIEGKHIFITGRIKDIIVLANGEKVSPTDMELAIITDPLFEHVMVVGEAKSCLTAVAVLNELQWQKFTEEKALEADAFQEQPVEKLFLDRIAICLHDFPGYAQLIRISCTTEPWTVENGLLTPTLKVKRNKVAERFKDEIELMYEGH